MTESGRHPEIGYLLIQAVSYRWSGQPIAVIFNLSGKITVFFQYQNDSDTDDTADRRSDDYLKYTQIQQDDCRVVRKTDWENQYKQYPKCLLVPADLHVLLPPRPSAIPQFHWHRLSPLEDTGHFSMPLLYNRIVYLYNPFAICLFNFQPGCEIEKLAGSGGLYQAHGYCQFMILKVESMRLKK